MHSHKCHIALKHITPIRDNAVFTILQDMICYGAEASAYPLHRYSERWKILDFGPNDVFLQCVCVHTVPFGVPKFQILESWM